MAPKPKRRVLEDPNNTWNHQLMQASLQFNISDAEAVFANGANPIAAREAVPFYPEPLPPLIALLLQARYTTESVAMMNWLIEHGASLSQEIPLHGKNLLTSPDEQGSVLHLFVQLGQLSLLLDALALVGERRPPPMSIMKRMPHLELHSAAVGTNAGMGGSGGTSAAVARVGNASAGGGKRSGRASRVTPDSSAASATVSSHRTFTDTNIHVTGDVIDFSKRTSINGWTAMDLALRRGDAMAVQLLLYYGAPGVFHRLVNGSQTTLARACVSGDKDLVEMLLDAGDDMWQLSLDGRYTLVHYAAAQPAVLDVLLQRGLSIDAPNAMGESALVSLICYGQGRNADYAIRETPHPADAARLAALPPPALRNYILTPYPPFFTGTSSKTSKAPNTAASGTAMDLDYPRATHDADAWWYFATNSNAWEMVQNLCDRGADIHGDASNDERRKVEWCRMKNKQGPSAVQWCPSLSSSSALLSDDQSESFTTSSPIFTDHHRDKDEASPSMQHVTRMTPIMHAIVAYHPELIRRLAVEYRADPMVQDAQGACALHYAALTPHPSVMELFLSSFVAPMHPKFDINLQDCLGRTPLHYAAEHGNVGVVRVLLAAGSMLHAGKVDFAGRTPLHLAVLSRETAVVELLLQHAEGASSATVADTTSNSSGMGRKKSTIATNSARRKMRRPFSTADSSMLEQAMLFTDVEAEDLAMGHSALEMAVIETRDAATVRALLTIGCASVRHSSGLQSGGNLLHRTVADGSTAIMLLLLENYADPNEVDECEQTPLHLAAQSTLPQACEMVRELLRFGATAEMQSGCTLDTPIHIAARRGDAGMLNLLLHQKPESTSGHTGVLRSGGRERTRSISKNRPCMSPTTSWTPTQPSFVPRRSPRQQQQQQQRRGRPHPPAQHRLSTSSMVSETTECFTYGNNSTSIQGGNSRTDGEDGLWGAGVNRHTACSPTESGRATPERLPMLNPQHLLLTDAQGRTALHLISSHNDVGRQRALLPLVHEILQGVLAPTLVLHVDMDGRIPLHDACAAGYTEAVRELLQYDDGSCAFALDSRGCTPLHYAAMADREDCILALLHNIEMWLPCTLKGGSSVVSDPSMVPVTSRILQHHKQQQQWWPHDLSSNPLSHEGTRDMCIDSVWAYLNVHENMGRTPLLLAAELGCQRAGKMLMRLLRQHKAPCGRTATPIAAPCAKYVG